MPTALHPKKNGRRERKRSHTNTTLGACLLNFCVIFLSDFPPTHTHYHPIPLFAFWSIFFFWLQREKYSNTKGNENENSLMLFCSSVTLYICTEDINTYRHTNKRKNPRDKKRRWKLRLGNEWRFEMNFLGIFTLHHTWLHTDMNTNSEHTYTQTNTTHRGNHHWCEVLIKPAVSGSPNSSFEDWIHKL